MRNADTSGTGTPTQSKIAWGKDEQRNKADARTCEGGAEWSLQGRDPKSVTLAILAENKRGMTTLQVAFELYMRGVVPPCAASRLAELYKAGKVDYTNKRPIIGRKKAVWTVRKE